MGRRSLAIRALTVKVSVIASPKVALFSTVKVEMEVVDKVVPPDVVRDLAKMSPSASTKNLTLPLTAMPSKLESLTDEVALR